MRFLDAIRTGIPSRGSKPSLYTAVIGMHKDLRLAALGGVQSGHANIPKGCKALRTGGEKGDAWELFQGTTIGFGYVPG